MRPKGARRVHRKTISIVAAVALAGAVCAGIASAATTITSPLNPGSPPYTRDPQVSFTVNPVAAQFGRSGTSATSNFTRSAVLAAACSGDNPAGVNNSPRTLVEVIGPGSTGTVFSQTSPVLKNASLGDALGGYQEAVPQPGPSNTNWRGGAYGSTVPGNGAATNTTRPWTVTADLTGKPGGTYTVRTTTINMIRTGGLLTPGPCMIGQANFVSGAWANTFSMGPLIENQTFEYRPWQRIFKDVLNNGKVNVNLNPSEFQASTNNQTGTIYADSGNTMQFFNAPALSSIMLPADPAACAANPQSCLPATAVECTPGAAGCNPRLLIINKPAPGDQVRGIFDLQSGLFIAAVNVNGSQRVLFSLGSADNTYRGLLTQLNTLAAAQGVDLASILATTVRIRLSGSEYKVSLINGLQIDPTVAGNGVAIVTDASAQAGLILNIFSQLGGAACPGGSAGDSDPTTPAPDRYTHLSDSGYTVEKSDLLPEIPRVGAVGALIGGPIYHIEGDFTTSGSTLVNTSMAVIGADVDDDDPAKPPTTANPAGTPARPEPNGLPLWIQPFLSSPGRTTVARTMDFIGTATFAASETDLGALGCLTVDFMLGAGVAIFNNPLPIGFGDIPIWNPQSAEVQALMAQVNAAVADVINQVATNPTVADLLAQLTGALPPVEGVPDLG